MPALPMGATVGLKWSWFWKDWFTIGWKPIKGTDNRRIFNADYSWVIFVGPLQVWRLEKK